MAKKAEQKLKEVCDYTSEELGLALGERYVTLFKAQSEIGAISAELTKRKEAIKD